MCSSLSGVSSLSMSISPALTSLIAKDPTSLMRLFGAEHYATAPLGLVDFMYALGDSTATAVQYGNKALLCEALAPLYARRVRARRAVSDWEYAQAFANYTSHAWGPTFMSGCFYNSSCMRAATRVCVA